jgi:hypothetical protein
MTRRHARSAAFAVVLLLVGNVLAWVHESEVRHVTCAEHGEELHAVESKSEPATSDDSRWVAIDGQGGEHRDCSIARLLRTSTRTTSGSCTPTVVIAVATAETTALVPRIAAVDVIAIAPKTSPPT